jgi:hypothetical protein
MGPHGEQPVRDEAIREAFTRHGYKLKEIGDHLGLHCASVARIISKPRR